MHIQVIRNDHAPYAALVKIRDTMDADPTETWYIHPCPEGYYAHKSDSGVITDGVPTVAEAVLLAAGDAVAELFVD